MRLSEALELALREVSTNVTFLTTFKAFGNATPVQVERLERFAAAEDLLTTHLEKIRDLEKRQTTMYEQELAQLGRQEASS